MRQHFHERTVLSEWTRQRDGGGDKHKQALPRENARFFLSEWTRRTDGDDDKNEQQHFHERTQGSFGVSQTGRALQRKWNATADNEQRQRQQTTTDSATAADSTRRPESTTAYFRLSTTAYFRLTNLPAAPAWGHSFFQCEREPHRMQASLAIRSLSVFSSRSSTKLEGNGRRG